MFKITVIALGSKMPAWVNEAVSEFSKRLKEFAQVTFIEIPLIKRGKSNTLARIMEKEEILVNAAIPPSAHLIALAIDGKSFGSETLAKKMLDLQQKKSHIALLIGGPEGISNNILQQCQEKWSLSQLTLPHPLARIVLLEALYRAFTINANHPYHRGSGNE